MIHEHFLLEHPRNIPPLTPAVFAILLALADGEKHGYGIMLEARQHSAMGPGTLYGSLDRLLASGLIAETGFTDDERRRYYRPHRLGTAGTLAAEAARMQQAVARVRRKGVETAGGKSMNTILNLYRVALELYPQAFRERYAAEMLTTARRLAADAASKPRFAASLAWDTLSSLTREHMRLASPLKPAFLLAFAVFFSVLLLALSVFHQQVLRRGADRQPEQVAINLSTQLAHGDNRSFTLPGPQQDLGSSTWLNSNATFAAVYDASGNIVASNATFDNALPQPPRGIFSTIRARGLYKVTWQPQREACASPLPAAKFPEAASSSPAKACTAPKPAPHAFDLFLKLMWAMLLVACGVILVLANAQRRMRSVHSFLPSDISDKMHPRCRTIGVGAFVFCKRQRKRKQWQKRSAPSAPLWG